MKISHELPLSLLNFAQSWNDYDYCLPHLLDKYETYKAYFLAASKVRRFIVMDNGLFEGVEHTTDDLIEKIKLIEPDIFIVPDVWNDSSETLSNAHIWMNEIKPLLPRRTQLMVVLQGTNFNDFVHVFETAKKDGYRRFAFNHSSIAYQNEFRHRNPLVNQMMGRIDIITSFFDQNMIETPHDYIHLLGCSLPQELMYYGDYPINSVDSSNPIMFGLEGISYDHSRNLLYKPTTKIDQVMDLPSIDINDLKIIIENINIFRQYING